jgi:hypothetical protein
MADHILLRIHVHSRMRFSDLICEQSPHGLPQVEPIPSRCDLANGGLNPPCQTGGPRSIQLALKLHFEQAEKWR